MKIKHLSNQNKKPVSLGNDTQIRTKSPTAERLLEFYSTTKYIKDVTHVLTFIAVFMPSAWCKRESCHLGVTAQTLVKYTYILIFYVVFKHAMFQ